MVSSEDVFVQAGVFASEDNAMTMKMALYNMKEPVVIQKDNIGGADMYRVKIGPLSSTFEAHNLVSTLQKQGRDARILTASR